MKCVEIKYFFLSYIFLNTFIDIVERFFIFNFSDIVAIFKNLFIILFSSFLKKSYKKNSLTLNLLI